MEDEPLNFHGNYLASVHAEGGVENHTEPLHVSLPKNMKKAVLLEDPRPERPCCVRLEMTSTFPLLLSSIISYTPSSYVTGVFRSKGKS